MIDAMRELKVDELENVAGSGGGSSGDSGGCDTSGPLSSKELKSIVWGGSHDGKN
jgi:hypothetical protein